MDVRARSLSPSMLPTLGSAAPGREAGRAAGRRRRPARALGALSTLLGVLAACGPEAPAGASAAHSAPPARGGGRSGDSQDGRSVGGGRKPEPTSAGPGTAGAARTQSSETALGLAPTAPIGVFQTEQIARRAGDIVTLDLDAGNQFRLWRCPDAACERPTSESGRFWSGVGRGYRLAYLYEPRADGVLEYTGWFAYVVRGASLAVWADTSGRWTQLDPIDQSLCDGTEGRWSDGDVGPSGAFCDCGRGRGWSTFGCRSPGEPVPFEGPGTGSVQRFQDVRVVALPVSLPIAQLLDDVSDQLFTFRAAGYGLALSRLAPVLADSAALRRFAYDALFQENYPAGSIPETEADVSSTSRSQALGQLEASLDLEGNEPSRAPAIRQALSTTVDALFAGATFQDPAVLAFIVRSDDGYGTRAVGLLAINPAAGVARVISVQY